MPAGECHEGWQGIRAKLRGAIVEGTKRCPRGGDLAGFIGAGRRAPAKSARVHRLPRVSTISGKKNLDRWRRAMSFSWGKRNL